MYPNQYPYPNAAQAAPYAKQQQYIKDFLKKPISIILAVLFSINFIALLVSIITVQSALSSSYMAESGGSITVPLIIALLFFAVLVLGAWLAVIKSINSDPSSSPSAGLSTIKGFVITLLVLLCIAFLFILIAVIGLAGANATGELSQFSYYFEASGIDLSTVSQALGLFVFILLLAFVILLLDVIALLKTVSSLKNSLKSPLLSLGGAGMLAGFSIFFAVIFLISLFSANGLTFSNFLSLATNICLAVFAITYRSHAIRANAEISAAMNPYPQGYPAAPVPQPPVYGTPYPQQPMNPQYPYPQNYTQPAPQPYDNPYVQADAPTQTPPAAAVQPRYCPACGTQTTNPDETTCINCGYKF